MLLEGLTLSTEREGRGGKKKESDNIRPQKEEKKEEKGTCDTTEPLAVS